MPHAFVTSAGWVQIVKGAMKPCISVYLIAQDTESSTLTLANANAIPNGLEGIATSVSSVVHLQLLLGSKATMIL